LTNDKEKAMTGEFDPFKGAANSFIDDIDITFRNVRFGKHPNYMAQDGELPVVMIVDLESDDLDSTAEDQIFTIGKGWEAEDGGAKAVRADGRTRGFTQGTKAQLFIDAALDVDEQAFRGRYEQTGNTPQDAGFWEGLQCHVEAAAIEYDIKGEGKKSSTYLVPTEIFGWDEGEKKPAKKSAAKKSAAKKSVSKRPAKKAEVEEEVEEAEVEVEETSTVDAAIIAQIRKIAEEVDGDDGEFIDRCYAEIDGIEDDEEIMALVDDLDEGVWAEVYAEA